MKTPFLIYIRAVGIYALVTLPFIIVPPIYVLSLVYVGIFGWIAWGLFTMIYLFIDAMRVTYTSRMFILVWSVVASVALSYYILVRVMGELDVWHSDFIAFPTAAVIAGWIALFFAWKMVRKDCPRYSAEEPMDIEQ